MLSVNNLCIKHCHLPFLRNPVIQILYATLLIFGYGSYTETVFPHVSETFMGQLPYYLLVINLAFFAACGCTNPGVITKGNVDKYLKDFKYDGILYIPKDCRTCLIKKPARSKHCGMRVTSFSIYFIFQLPTSYLISCFYFPYCNFSNYNSDHFL